MEILTQACTPGRQQQACTPGSPAHSTGLPPHSTHLAGPRPPTAPFSPSPASSRHLADPRLPKSISLTITMAPCSLLGLCVCMDQPLYLL